MHHTYLQSLAWYTNHFKALRHASHILAINAIPAFYLVSVHQMAPPPTEVANI